NRGRRRCEGSSRSVRRARVRAVRKTPCVRPDSAQARILTSLFGGRIAALDPPVNRRPGPATATGPGCVAARSLAGAGAAVGAKEACRPVADGVRRNEDRKPKVQWTFGRSDCPEA